VHIASNDHVYLGLFFVQNAMRFGYVPEEVEFAVHHYEGFDGRYKTPLDFLHREWHERKKMVQNHIGRHTRDRGMADVGIPSFIEARDCLLECAGNINEAIALCAHRREEKVGICRTWRGDVLHNVCVPVYLNACSLVCT